MSLRFARALPLAVLLGTLALGAGASAQVIPPGMDSLRLGPVTPGLPDLTGTGARAVARVPSSVLLEGTVSRTEYVLGASDVLTVSLFGFRSDMFVLEVSPEGTIVIPTVGVVPVGGLDLERAETLVAQRVRRYNQDVDVSLTLAALRSFKVFLLGDLPDPGVREATAVTRVSEVIPAATSAGVIHRNVVVRRRGQAPIGVDLASYLQTGDLSQNPTLREGDVIYVPPVDETVTVSGRVAFPGTYEYRESETLAGLLAIANGGGSFPADAADTLRLMRFVDRSERVIHAISRADANGPIGEHMSLAPFDAIYVPRIVRFKRSTTATVSGEVNRPGTYPIIPDETTVGDLISMAGGLTAQASLLDAVLRRAPLRAQRVSESLESVPPELLSVDERRILQVTRRSDNENVVLDLQELLETDRSTYDVPLEDGDTLAVPEQRPEVTVLGAVFEPGIVAFEPGRSIEEFVALAGGYTQRADRDDVVVLKGKLGNRLEREDVLRLEPGDRIIVPFTEPKTFLERVQTVQGVVSTVSGLILAVVALDRIW